MAHRPSRHTACGRLLSPRDSGVQYVTLDPAILRALDDVLKREPQREELKIQMRQLVANWFSRNATDDDVARLVQRVAVRVEED